MTFAFIFASGNNYNRVYIFRFQVFSLFREIMLTFIRIKKISWLVIYFLTIFYQFEIQFLPQTTFKWLCNGLLSINGKLGQIIMLVMKLQYKCCWEQNWNKQLTRETTNGVRHITLTTVVHIALFRYLYGKKDL